jgi:hypothetical protein
MATLRTTFRPRPGAMLAGMMVIAGSLAQASRVLAQSCAMCASSFGPNDPTSRAFSWSILFLMAAPYTIVGSVAGWLFFAYRRAPGRPRAAVIDLAQARQAAPARPTGGDVP